MKLDIGARKFLDRLIKRSEAERRQFVILTPRDDDLFTSVF